MATKNKRLELQEFDAPLLITEGSLPEAPPGGAVIKVHYAGICHSDVHMVYGENADDVKKKQFRSRVKRPAVPGHEISGEIFSFGSDVDAGSCGYKIGDNVMLYPWIGCGQCVFCKAGDCLLCLPLILFSHGVSRDGGFQQYVRVGSLSDLRRVPRDFPMDIASVIPCSGITAYSAIMRIKPVIEKFSKYMEQVALLIVGAGGLGLWGIQIAKAAMPKNTNIYVAEVAESKFQTALDAGADQTILWDPKASVQDKIAATKAAIPEGLHAVVDFVGSDSTVQTSMGSVGKGATIVGVGLYRGTYSVNSDRFPIQMLTITGSLVGTKEDMTSVVELVAAGKVTGPPLSHVTLEEVNEVMEGLLAGTRKGRCVVRLL